MQKASGGFAPEPPPVALKQAPGPHAMKRVLNFCTSKFKIQLTFKSLLNCSLMLQFIQALFRTAVLDPYFHVA
jgi:hypothetical protein